MTLEQQLENAAARGATRAVQLVVSQLSNQLGLVVMRPEDDAVLTLEEAAAWLHVDPDTLRGQARSGTVPAARLGVQWRFHKAALRRYLDPHLIHLDTRHLSPEIAAD